MISRFIGQEAKANSRRKKKRPWKQVVAIGLARARKEGLLVAKPSAIPIGSSYNGPRMSISKKERSHPTTPTGEGKGRKQAAYGRQQAIYSHHGVKRYDHSARKIGKQYYHPRSK
jgi:hypothetical protein